MANKFHSLRLVQKIEETGDSCSFIFEIPADIKDQYAFKAGQYLTLKLDVGGAELRRAYSIFTTPDQKEMGITVKRVQGGKVSNHLIDNFKVGDVLEVMTPEGRFVVKPDHLQHRDHYFIAGGSGITPVMSMIKTLLESEPKSTCYLLYANRNEDNIIFKKELDDMLLRYEDQFFLSYILSQPHQAKAGGLSGLFGKKAKPTWKGMRGRINQEILTKYLEDHPSKSRKDSFYLCGPGGMIETTEQWLIGQGIESVQIKKEFFTNANESKAAEVAAMTGKGSQATVKLNGETFSVIIPSEKTILDTLIEEGKDPPYSCTSGACSTCVAKVTNGSAEMEVCFALDDEEVEDGYILTCQAKCTSPTLELDFDA